MFFCLCLIAGHVLLYRDMRFVDRVEFSVQVQLRFCLVDSSCRQPDCFPSSIGVKVNNMPATLPVCIGHCTGVLAWRFTLWHPLLPYGYSYKASCVRLGSAVIWILGTLTLMSHMATVGVKGLTVCHSRLNRHVASRAVSVDSQDLQSVSEWSTASSCCII